jgi:hypothetical protein
MTSDRQRFERRNTGTLSFPVGDSALTVAIVTSRIVRVALEDTRHLAGPSYVVDRKRQAAPFDILDEEPLRLVTTDLQVQIGTSPLRIAFLDPSGEWLVREPADAGMSAEASGDSTGRSHLRASFVFSGEQHFYGLGQAAEASIASASRASSGTRTSGMARARTSVCRCSHRAEAMEYFSTIRETRRLPSDDRTTASVSSWTGARYDGPAGITVQAPLERLPLLVRGGAIVPMGPVVQHTGERPLDDITLRIYPEGSSRFELYEDDGRTNAYQRGQYALTAFECAVNPGEVAVRIGEAVGDRSVVPPACRYRLELKMDLPATVTVAGHGELARLAGEGGGAGWWTDDRGFTVVRLPDGLTPPIAVTLRT